eukprot:scaffold9550_cov111-Isochrysis_galbana.AAC.3
MYLEVSAAVGTMAAGYPKPNAESPYPSPAGMTGPCNDGSSVRRCRCRSAAISRPHAFLKITLPNMGMFMRNDASIASPKIVGRWKCSRDGLRVRDWPPSNPCVAQG